MNSYQIDREKWATLTIFEQMGNIYSEVGRTFNAKQHNNAVDAKLAAIRTLDLFDATAEVLAKQKSPKLHEVLRVREIFADEYFGADKTSLDSYLMQFALTARMRQFV